jgi:hypothetical protein
MHSVRRLFAAFAVATLVAAPVSAVTKEGVDRVDSEFAPPMLDVLVLRPVGLVGLMLSSMLWVPAELMTVCVNPTEWKVPVDHLLTKPARYVFVDPIGSH